MPSYQQLLSTRRLNQPQHLMIPPSVSLCRSRSLQKSPMKSPSFGSGMFLAENPSSLFLKIVGHKKMKTRNSTVCIPARGFCLKSETNVCTRFAEQQRLPTNSRASPTLLSLSSFCSFHFSSASSRNLSQTLRMAERRAAPESRDFVAEGQSPSSFQKS